MDIDPPLPEYLPPELASPLRPALTRLRRIVLDTPGLIAGWLAPEMLGEIAPAGIGVAPQAMQVVFLVDRGEGIETHANRQARLQLRRITPAQARLETALGADLARTLAFGYRLCGADGIVHELEALARATLKPCV